MSILAKLFRGGAAARAKAPQKCLNCLKVYEESRRTGARLADAYVGSIDAISDNLCGLPEARLREYRRNLAALREMVVPAVPAQGLKLLRKDLEKVLRSYRDEFDSCLNRREQQARESMAALAILAELMSERDRDYQARFKGISKKLLRLAATPDMETIHQTLMAEIRQLTLYAEETGSSNQLAVQRVIM